MKKILSIIVPVYKVEDYLEKCVLSLIDGVGENNLDKTEIILVDDGSPDNCPTICDNLADKYKNLKVIHQKNAGVSAARNAGINAASGEYITFCDSDDFVDKNICKIFSFINNNPNTQVFSVGLKKNDNLISVFNQKQLNPQNFEDILFAAKNDITISCCAKIVKRDFILNNKLFFPTGIKSEDLVWSYNILFKSTNYMLLDLVYYNYVDRESSITHTFNLKGIQAQIENYRRLKNLVLQLNITKKQQKQLLRYLMQGYIYTIYTAKYLNKKDKKEAKNYFKQNKDLLYPPHNLKLYLFYLYTKVFSF